MSDTDHTDEIGAETPAPDLLLGLIGDNIDASSAPRLHRLAGLQFGLKVQYDRLVPPILDKSFEQVFSDCADRGYRGVNITYPYKERVFGLVTVEDEVLTHIKAVNTVLFTENGPVGSNTDYTGFVDGYRGVRGTDSPGVVAQVGTGGAGRAVGFGLIALGAEEIRISDRDRAKAEALAAELRSAAASGTRITVGDGPDAIAHGANGLINCTPMGMIGFSGTAIPDRLLDGADWVFDAVYTPIETPFIKAAIAAGLEIVSGYELFIYQGVNAWKIFSGRDVDVARLRRDLAATTAD